MNSLPELGAENVERHILVTVDDREMHDGVANSLRALPDVHVEIKRLPLGDYLVDDRCLFERKTVADFATSVLDGRLFSQAARLMRYRSPTALILEGRASDLTHLNIRRETLQGAMITLTLIFRLPVLRALDCTETARLILYAGKQLRRHEQDRFYRVGQRPKGKRRQQLHLLQGLPGIGPEKAARLLETFGTVAGVMTAEPEKLESVAGIGSKTASAITEVLRETPVPYRIEGAPGLDI